MKYSKIILIFIILGGIAVILSGCQKATPTPTPTLPPPTEPTAAATINPLIDAVWKLTKYAKEGGALIAPVHNSTLTITFLEDGTFGGNAGCNNYSGTYELAGNQIKIDPAIAITEMYCESPEGVMEQEQDYLQALSQAAGFVLNGTELILIESEGGQVINYLMTMGIQ